MTRSEITPFRPVQYLLLLAGLLFLWPGIVNSGPFYFNDTTAYVRGVDAAVFHTTGIASDWTARPQPTTTPSSSPKSTVTTPNQPVNRKPVLLGRSAYYGVILYFGVIFQSFWVVLLLQCMIVASILLIFLRHFVDPADTRKFAVATVSLFALLALTPLPFFVCLLMPDLFSGIAIVAALLVLLRWKQERPSVRFYLVAILALAALVHSSNVLLIAGLGFVFALWQAFRKQRHPGMAARALPPAILLGCALIGVGGEAVFSAAITRMTGQAPIRPPFLTARFVDDGPGTAYLRDSCDHSDLVLCGFVDRLPVPSDGFLWDPDPRTGVFMAVPPAQQRLLSAEQVPFVLASVRHAPIETAAMLMRDFATQVGKRGLSEFAYNEEQRRYFNNKLPAPTLSDVRQSPAYRNAIALAPFEAIALLLTILSVAVLLSSFHPRSHLAPWSGYAALALAGVLINDVICGCLSTPHDRYQMRVIWVLPAVALALLIARRANAVRADRRESIAAANA